MLNTKNSKLKFKSGVDLESTYDSLFRSRDDFDTPPPSDEALARNHFQHSTPPPPSASAEAPAPQPLYTTPSNMASFTVGVRVQVLCAGFGGTKFWTGTIVKRLDSFDKKDCKLSIKFDDKRYKRPFVYKFSEYSTAIAILEERLPALEELPHTPLPEPTVGPVDSVGRQLRARNKVDYTNSSVSTST